MALNFPGPFEVRIFYQTNETPAAIAAHVLRLSCNMSIEGDPGDPFSEWIPYQKNGSAVSSLDTHVDALMAVVRPFYVAAVDFVGAELWEYAPGTFDAVYRASYTLGLAGTGAGTTQVAGQLVTTFRTVNGGIFKIDLRGTNIAAGATQSFPIGAGVATNLANYLVGGTTIWWARDNSYPLVPLKYMPGQNEKAWRVAFRP